VKQICTTLEILPIPLPTETSMAYHADRRRDPTPIHTRILERLRHHLFARLATVSPYVAVYRHAAAKIVGPGTTEASDLK
jgi:hypothetical protein